MTPLEGFKELLEFAVKAGSANMLMAADSGQAEDSIVVFQRLSLTERVSNDFLGNIVSTLGKDGSEPALRDYAPGYTPSSYELCYVKLSDNEPVSAMLDSVSDIGGAAIFKEEENIINRLRFYAIVAESKSHPQKPAFLRLYSPKKELTRSHWTALWQRNDKYDHVTRKIFLFDDKFDCFSWKDYLFIRHVGNFQEIFGYFAELVAKGEKAIGEVTTKIQIKNEADFVAGVKADSRMLARLAQTVRKPYFKTLTMAQIKKTIKEYHVDAKVVVDGGVEKLVFERGPSTRWNIFKLLDDFFVKSDMTGTKYEANSKVAIR